MIIRLSTLATGRASAVCATHLCRRMASSAQPPPPPDAPDAPDAAPATLKDAPETHFGFKTVPTAKKADLVGQVFSSVADKYDVMNDAMSGGIHRLWKDTFVRHRLNAPPGTRLLDVAGGTGDIALRFLRHARTQVRPVDCTAPTQVVVCDINQDMLNAGMAKAQSIPLETDEQLDWVCGNAECLPFDDASFDAYTIAFGIRNVTHIDKALLEAFRVLRPGGRLLILEFSHVEQPLLKPLYDLYSFQVIPVLGHLIAGDHDSYAYLVESIRRFPRPAVFSDMIRHAGFRLVSHEPLTAGIAAIHSAYKL